MLIAVAGLGARCCADQHEDCSSTQCWPWLDCVAYTDADEQPAETCEIPCAADADCPWEQRCVEVTPGPGPVCMECMGEGGATDDPARCCDGLTALTGCTPGEPCEPGYWCAACGDGVCGEHESPWECPADCADCESLGLDDRACAGLTVRFWTDEQRRRTAEELNALPFDERAERINAAGWFGQVPGAAVVEFHADGMLRHLARVALAPGDLGIQEGLTPEEAASAVLSRLGMILFGLGSEVELARASRSVELTGETVVIFRQSFGGVPLVDGSLFVTFDGEGRLTGLRNDTLPGISHGTTPEATLDDALEAIGALIGEEVDDAKHGLFIVSGENDRADTRLVWDVAVASTATGRSAGAFRVDAHTGEVLLRHDPDWRFPPPPPPPQLSLPAEMRFYNAEVPYDSAYCKEWNDVTQTCDEWFYAGDGDGNYSPNDTGVDFSDDLIWEDGAWASGGLPDPWYYSFSPMAYLLWEMIRSDYPDNPAGILGNEFSPFRLFFGVYMESETVAYAAQAYWGAHEGLHHVDGAHSVGTTAHEFGHRLHQKGVLEPPGSEYLEEGIGDAMAMIYTQRYQVDPAAPEYHCADSMGYPYAALPDPGIAHSCFNVWREEPFPSFYHQNIQVQQIGNYTRCSAIEALAFGDDQADMPENIWRSLRNPKERNHGHGRGPLTYDQLLNDKSKLFSRTVVEMSDGFGPPAYLNTYCGSDDSCECGANFGVSHANMGPHNRFFYDLSGLDDAAFPLVEGDPAAAAEKQRQLLDAIYAENIPTYLEWTERVTDIAAGAVPVGGLTGQQAANIMKSLRETKIFGEAGRIEDASPSDLDAVVHWKSVDEQRLVTFFRVSEAYDPDGYHNFQRYERPLWYAVTRMDGASADWSDTTLCEMPQVPVPDLGDQSARSGFAPTAVNLGQAIWVGWSQYDEPPAGQVGSPHGHLAHAMLYPNFISDQNPCGTWSGVDYDPDTVVHGSPRATVVDRGSIYIIEIPPFYQDPCINCDVPIHVPWFPYVDPVDQTTLGMLANLGFTPDVDMDTVWDGHPGWDGGAVSTMASEIPEDYEAENLVHMHTAIRGIMTDDGLGVNRRPLHDDALAPKGAEAEVGLRTLALNGAMSMSAATNPEILEAASLLLPNAVQFITQPPPTTDPLPPIVLDADLVQGLGRMAGKWALDIQVRTVAVAFLEGDAGADGRRDVVVRQYGVDEDPFASVDTVIGRARFVPGLATLGRNEYREDELHGAILTNTVYRDNVVACTDFAYDGMTSVQDAAMNCKVFRNGVISPWGEQRWFASPFEGMGPDIDATASPRAVNVGDAAYVFFRGQDGKLRYVAFGGADLTPITYNALLFGLEFPTDEGGPRRWVSSIETELQLPLFDEKQGVDWPVAPGAPFALPHGGMGYAGRPSGYDHVKIYTRGMGLAW